MLQKDKTTECERPVGGRNSNDTLSRVSGPVWGDTSVGEEENDSDPLT